MNDQLLATALAAALRSWLTVYRQKKLTLPELSDAGPLDYTSLKAVADVHYDLANILRASAIALELYEESLLKDKPSTL